MNYDLLNSIEFIKNNTGKKYEIQSNKIKLGKYKLITKNDKNIQCSICLELLQPGMYKRILQCNHVFHKKCIDKWIFCKLNGFNLFCPCCRESIK